MAGIDVTTMDLTPKDARSFLETVVRNRSLNQVTVNKYYNDMVSNRWTFAGDPIRFDDDGHMLDGSHRMTALAKCPEDTKITFVVMMGLSPESQFAMDQGRIRQTGAQLQMRGVKNATLVSAGVRLYLAWQQGWLFKDKKVIQEKITTAVIEEWVEHNSQAVDALQPILTTVQRSNCPGSVAYAAALIFADIDLDACAEFFFLLHRGAGFNHPITALDKRLQRIRRERTVLPQKDLLGMLIQTWNAWRNGRELQKFQLPKGGTWTKDTFPVAVER